MKFTKRDKRNELEKLMDEKLEFLLETANTYEDIELILSYMERRNTLLNDKKRVSPDTIAIVAGNLVGIMLILGYEKINVITSKALGFVIRGRV